MSSKRIEEKYKTWIDNLLKPIKRKVMEAAKSGDVDKVERILKKATKSKLFKSKADDIAKKMVTMTLEEEAKDWREAARKASKNPEIYQSLMIEMNGKLGERYNELIERNATIIKTLPLDISRDVVKHISRRSFEGDRSSEIAKEIRSFFPTHTKAKENLIARTESSKCRSALTQARSEEVGVYWAIWRTSEDSVVRSSHHVMQNVLFNYNHLPSPEELARKAGVYKGKSYGRYGPGEIFNCRCYVQPIIILSQTRFPAKVYNWKSNSIESMTKEQFEKFAKDTKSYASSWEEFK